MQELIRAQNQKHVCLSHGYEGLQALWPLDHSN